MCIFLCMPWRIIVFAGSGDEASELYIWSSPRRLNPGLRSTCRTLHLFRTGARDNPHLLTVHIHGRDHGCHAHQSISHRRKTAYQTTLLVSGFGTVLYFITSTVNVNGSRFTLPHFAERHTGLRRELIHTVGTIGTIGIRPILVKSFAPTDS